MEKKNLLTIVSCIILLLLTPSRARADVTFYASGCIRAINVFACIWTADKGTGFPGLYKESTSTDFVGVSTEIIDGVEFTKYVVKGYDSAGLVLSYGTNVSQTEDITIEDGKYYVLYGKKESPTYERFDKASDAATAVRNRWSFVIKGTSADNDWNGIEFTTKEVTDYGMHYSYTFDATSWTANSTQAFKFVTEYVNDYSGFTNGWLANGGSVDDLTGGAPLSLTKNAQEDGEPGNMKFTHNSDYNKYVMDVYYRPSLNAYYVYIKGLPQPESSATAYYLIGDWTKNGDNWNIENTNFKMQPVYGQDGVYSIYINAPWNNLSTYAAGFVINPEGNTNLEKCIRPVGGGNYSVDNTDYSGQTRTGTTNSWQFKKNTAQAANNGGSYLLIYNSNDRTFEIKNTPDLRVLYMMRSDKNWEFDGEYLFDVNTSGVSYYNNNYVGTLTMASGIEYKLTDGYNWYGSTDGELSYNAGTNITYNKVCKGSSSDDSSGKNNVPFNIPAATYSAVANVVGLNNPDSYDFDSPAKTVIWTQVAPEVNMSKPQYKSSATVTDWTDMTYDDTYRVWTATGVSLANNETVNYREHFYNGSGTGDVMTLNANNGANGQGTYKLVYVPTYQSGTGEAAEKLMLQTKISKVCVDDDAAEKEYKYIRTFSDYQPRLIPEGLKAYRATAYNATKDGEGKTTSATVTLTSIPDIIPANTGVILVYDGETESVNFDDYNSGAATWAALEVSEEEGSAPRDNGDKPYGNGIAEFGAGTNWLVSLLTDGSATSPADRDGEDEVIYRNYYLTRVNGKLGFYRVKAEEASATPVNLRKSYLALPAEVQDDSDFDEPGLGYDGSGAKQIAMIFEEGTTETEEPIIGNETDGIVKPSISTANNDNCYYNMMGMKVMHPTSGLYIRNGKKIIIK